VILNDIDIAHGLVTITNAISASRRRWIALVVVCLGQLMMVVDATIVNVALPSIQRDLDFSQADLTWVVNAYLIAFGSFLLMAGRLGDLVGRKKVFLLGLTLFTVSSALCGLADDKVVLIVARFIQGLGGAIASSAVLALIVTEFPRPDERIKAMSAYMFTATAGGSLGLIAGGALTQSLDWHWIFFVNVPIGLFTLWAGSLMINETNAIGLKQGIDVLGSLLVTGSLMLLVYAIVTSTDHGWGSAHTLGFGGVGVALLAAFGWWESRVKNPIFPLWILRVRSLIGASTVRGLIVVGWFGSFFLGALYLEHVLGFDALQTGLAFLPMTMSVLIMSLGLSARIMARIGPLPMVVSGTLLTALGLTGLALADADANYFPLILISFIALGVSGGLSMLPLLTTAMSDVPERDAGLASGIVNVSMQVAAALGIAILGTLATDHTRTLVADGVSRASALTDGYHLAFTVGAGSAAFAALVALLVVRPPRPRDEVTVVESAEIARA
jgi:EmrB/QacA subfamily drug resistance transporter